MFGSTLMTRSSSTDSLITRGDIEFRGEGHQMRIEQNEMRELNKERGDWEVGLIISGNYDT